MRQGFALPGRSAGDACSPGRPIAVNAYNLLIYQRNIEILQEVGPKPLAGPPANSLIKL